MQRSTAIATRAQCTRLRCTPCRTVHCCCCCGCCCCSGTRSTVGIAPSDLVFFFSVAKKHKHAITEAATRRMSECPVRGCCTHLLQYKAEHGLQTLLTVRRYAELAERGAAARPRVPAPRCMTCGTADGRLLACLTCVHIACQHDTPLHYKVHGHALCLFFPYLSCIFFTNTLHVGISLSLICA